MSDTPTRDQNKFIVRMPEGMRERVKVRADENRRSMNAEIIDLIESGLEFKKGSESLSRTFEEIRELTQEWKSLYYKERSTSQSYISLIRSFSQLIVLNKGEVPEYIADYAKEMLGTFETLDKYISSLPNEPAGVDVDAEENSPHAENHLDNFGLSAETIDAILEKLERAGETPISGAEILPIANILKALRPGSGKS
ncbi:Arc family DNA-binding protein [Rhizobium sp. FY34]|uniref:Arc family DNA-binding protein n=1 Tax=Rhizobium sp. FY34 TaxID=2562309 RepID=UPI001485500D|nr:Arc family DNA-binding protein [Rhizobium sp. FY34]